MFLLNIFKKEKGEKKQIRQEKEKKIQPKPETQEKRPAEEKKKVEDAKGAVEPIQKEKKNAQAYQGILRPHVTEKSATETSLGKYIFEVDAAMNKIEIKKAIKALYGVKPVHVRIMNVSGKQVRYGKVFGKTSSWKKAIVSLKKGDTIEIYEGV